MSHVRTQLRTALVATLTGLATTGNRVHASRMRPQGDANLPCLLVTTNDEQIDSTVDAILLRDLSVSIRGFAMASAALDDTLDQIALEVESVMASNPRAIFERVEIDYDDELEKPVGAITLTYRIQYYTTAADPAVMI
jgi:hypothetical protein